VSDREQELRSALQNVNRRLQRAEEVQPRVTAGARVTELESIARQYVRENKLTLGEQLALSVFVAKASKLLQPQLPTDNVEELGVVDRERGWRLVTEG
jgi:hypothetical protein